MGSEAPRLVWDRVTRLFHWALVILILVSVSTGGEEGWSFAAHVIAGHLILLLILFRWIWGVFGSPRSRFTDFLKPPGTILTYARGFLRGRPARSAGHNPLGALMVLAFLAVIPLIVITGIANARDEGFGLVSPLARFVPSGLGDFHEALVWLLYAMILAHIAAVFVDWWLTGDNLVAAMFTGRKSGTIEGPAELPFASRRRLLLAILPVALLGAWLFSGISPERLAAAEKDESGRGRDRGRGGDVDLSE
jgi:cytochrome b